MKIRFSGWVAGFGLLALLVTGCSAVREKIAGEMPSGGIARQVGQVFPSIKSPSPTPFQPVRLTATPTIAPTATPEPVKTISAWLDPALPDALRAAIQLPESVLTAPSIEEANLKIGALREGLETRATWVYALVAPFPTLDDETSLDEIQRAWRGEPGEGYNGLLLVSPSTRAAFAARWGPPGEGRVQTLADDQLIDEAWNNRPAWALVPFEAIQPRWKVLRVDGLSPLQKDLNLPDYPLTIWFGVAGEPEALALLKANLGGDPAVAALLPATNRDPKKMTVLVMTGVTALARATANRMDTHGTTYPAYDIQDWLRNADLTHISNEVSFTPRCPPGNPFSDSMLFCSRPEYIELLDFIGTDIVELSGNHNNDWGREPFSYSLDLYHQRGWTLFAGGANLEEARRPAKIENNGNRLAFIGCNPVGPSGVWATENQPGVASCGDYGWMLDEVRALRDEGYLPITTFQYNEMYTERPSDPQQRDFRAAVDAGAAIVSGSQAHYPQDMEFYNDGFIHYGLGNLFFDQMDVPVVGTRKEFIDRHVFYDGQYINTELLTAMLEDYARPRPMNAEERRGFLDLIFQAAGW